MKRKIVLLLSTLILSSTFISCGKDEKKEEAKTQENVEEGETTKGGNGLKVAATEAPHAEILEKAKELLKEKGVELEIVVYNDYVQPNLVVESGEFDANYFQHGPYLDSFNEEHKTSLVSAGVIHYEPLGIYGGKSKDLNNIHENAVIAVPNDATNEARALLLLQANGVLTLKKGAGIKATINDIEDNPHNVQIKELEAAQIPRVKDEMDFVVLNGNFALQAGFIVGKDALAYEKEDSEAAVEYANIVAVKTGNETNENIKLLIEVLHSKEIKTFIEDKYEGAVIVSETKK